jgi:transglutaminase-like putative cysteine protease
VTFAVSGQKITSDENINTANQLKQKYAESTAAILSAENIVDFELSEDQVKVIETNNNRIISLRINNEIKRTISYDINSQITDAYLRSEKNKSIRVTPLCGNYETEDIFHSDNMLCVYPLEFKNLGEVQNFSYKLTNNDIRYYTSVYFQTDVPIQKSKITFNVPSWLNLELKEINFEGYKIEKSSTKDPKKNITTYEFVATDLEEFRDEPNSYGISHTYPHLLIIAKSYRNSDGNNVNIISNSNDLHNWYNQLVLQLKNDVSSFKPSVENIVSNSKTDIDKIKAIYYWVQDNIRYIAFENGISGYKPAEAADVFKYKYGDCKGMANLTKWMLKTAGFDARLAWIGTTSIPYSYDIPSLAVNNHMICCVKYNNQNYYLDATEKYIGFNDYAERIQGKIVMVEDGKGYFLDTIPVLNKERNLNTINFDLSLQNNVLQGKCKQKYQGESHENILYYLNNEKSDSQKNFKEVLISSGDKNIKVENITSSDINDKENPYNIEADVFINNKVSNFEDEYYLDLDFYKEYKNERIKEDRKSDVFFDEKKFQKMTVNITIPSNLKVKYLPEPLEIKENPFSFSVRYSQNNNKIRYERTISIDNGVINKRDIAKWNSAIKSLSEKYNDNVILTKK